MESKVKLYMKNFMDFPMILSKEFPKEIDLIIEDIPRNFMLDVLKYLDNYSKLNNIKINLIDENRIIG